MPRKNILLVTALAAACATAPPPAPQPQPTTPPEPKVTSSSALEDRSGDSVETAIEVPADAPNEGFDFENNWIYGRFGRFRRMGGGTGQAAGRRYNIVEVELPDGSTHKVFFDITENWKRWTPPPQ